MIANSWTKRMVAASVGMAMLFTGNSLTRLGQAAQPEATQPPTVPTETVAMTQTAEPATMATAPQDMSAFEKIAAKADGTHIFVYDVTAGAMRFCNVAETEMLYPASITKLYAAVVALMYLEPETVVTAGEELTLMQPGSSRAYLSRGCKLTVEMLIEAMLIPSGNDASYVVAAAAGRTIGDDPDLDAVSAVEVFVEEMNRQSKALGLENSHFANPDGYHHEQQYICPKDAALIGSLALKQPLIAKYCGLQQTSVIFESGEHIAWYNTNHLINPESPYYCANAVGLKTGYTSQAGQCLLAAFRDDGGEVIVGIFGGETQYQRYTDAVKLYEACRIT